MTTPGNNDEVALSWRIGRVAALAAAGVIAVNTGAISLPRQGDNTQTTRVSDRSALAAQQEAADKQWASSACTSILDWKNELHHDETSTSLGFGPVARIQDAVAATKSMLGELDKLGLPPGAQGAQARAEFNQLRSDIVSRLRDLEGTASSVAGGNLAAIGTLLSDLENDKVLGPQIASELSHVASVDLGLSLAETAACRQLVGVPI
jgi:hypothetical protein